VALEFGAAVEMTSSACLTGTDRVAEVANRRNADWYINVQGDEPFVSPAGIRTVIDATRSVANEVAAINTMCVIVEEADFRSETVPKPVTDIHGRLLYISRAAIPTDKRLRFHTAYRQIGLYAFRLSALQLYQPGAEKTLLENIEDIEILRLLENGLRIHMVNVPLGGPAVDTPEDLQKAEEYLRSQEDHHPLRSD
jgi:3-deoxy-manno-octulosonate cytidylyltransferase (CMP-KDO synthetase)